MVVINCPAPNATVRQSFLITGSATNVSGATVTINVVDDSGNSYPAAVTVVPPNQFQGSFTNVPNGNYTLQVTVDPPGPPPTTMSITVNSGASNPTTCPSIDG